MANVGLEKLSFRILKKIRHNKGFYRDLLIEKLLEDNFSIQDIKKSINYLREQSMIICYGFHIVYSTHPNVELVFNKNPKINVTEFLDLWNDPDRMSELWDDETNEQ